MSKLVLVADSYQKTFFLYFGKICSDLLRNSFWIIPQYWLTMIWFFVKILISYNDIWLLLVISGTDKNLLGVVFFSKGHAPGIQNPFTVAPMEAWGMEVWGISLSFFELSQTFSHRQKVLTESSNGAKRARRAKWGCLACSVQLEVWERCMAPKAIGPGAKPLKKYDFLGCSIFLGFWIECLGAENVHIFLRRY